MSEIICFHLDENVSNAIAESLRRRGIDVTTTPSAGLMGCSDEEQIDFALEQNRVIFTQDTDFLRLNQAGFTHNGIVYCQQNSRSIGEIVRSLILIWEYLEPEEMRGRVEFI
jgi:predicted nuclease of predicted toxin-antitoxin system